MSEELLYTLEEVAKRTHFSLRSLKADCIAGRIDHVHRGRLRAMTPEQLARLIADHTKTSESTDVLAAIRTRVARRHAA
jgi:hypothetical protein